MIQVEAVSAILQIPRISPEVRPVMNIPGVRMMTADEIVYNAGVSSRGRFDCAPPSSFLGFPTQPLTWYNQTGLPTLHWGLLRVVRGVASNDHRFSDCYTSYFATNDVS